MDSEAVGEVMTLSEVAAYLRLAERTVLRMVHKEQIPCAKVASQWRFLRSMIDDWLITKMQVVPKNDLARLIEGGEEVQVVDSATGEDITVAVMARVIGERSTAWGSVADAKEVLRSIIYLGGNKSMSVLKNTILASIGLASRTDRRAGIRTRASTGPTSTRPVSRTRNSPDRPP